MLEKARAVMPAKPAKAGGAKGPAEPSRAASGLRHGGTLVEFSISNVCVCCSACRSQSAAEDTDSKPDVKKVRGGGGGGAAARKVTTLLFDPQHPPVSLFTCFTPFVHKLGF